MKFKKGDAIIHPVRGAGIVESVEERRWEGNSCQYYRVKLLGEPASSLMIPTDAAESLGLRRAIARSRIKQVWRVLDTNPGKLPTDHKKRYEILEEKLHAGDIFQVAEAMRDMTWQRQEAGNLTTRGKRIYDEGMMLLAGEIAATQGVPLSDAEEQVRARLSASVS